MTLTERIVELVPDAEKKSCVLCGTEKCEFTSTGCPMYRGKPITIADVLRAILKGPYALSPAEFTHDKMLLISEAEIDGEYPSEYWDLTTDLEGQSDETKAFLSKILGVTHT